jgi:hypothetical protein
MASYGETAGWCARPALRYGAACTAKPSTSEKHTLRKEKHTLRRLNRDDGNVKPTKYPHQEA